MSQWSKSNDVLNTMNRGNPCESGLCTLCRSDCGGKCETWLSSLKGRSLLYPRDFGTVTAGSGNTCHVGVSYNSLRIQGYNYGADGLAKGVSNSADNCLFTKVNLETSFGNVDPVKCRLPLMTGALGSTFIAAKYWDSFAIGGSLVGIPVVVGENVVGVDRESKLTGKKITKAPELDRRVETYLRYNDGYGAIIVQMNVEDTRLGTAEYVASKHNLETIELKWGQGAKCIGGEIKVKSLDRALELKKRGYIVLPDPTNPAIQEAYKAGAIKEFERHSRLGFVTEDGFLAEVDRLRDIGFKRVTLKTGAYSMKELAMAIKYSSEAKIDLLTIDGAPGGTGMSPWPMMEEWGIPTFYIEALTYEFCERLSKKGVRVPDIAIAGGIADEANAFKVLAMGSPYVKAVCMGRALMIPGMVGKNIQKWLDAGELPKTVSKYGSTVQEIFVAYEELKEKYGERMSEIPLGALALYTYSQKFKTGMQQIMAGSRNFSLASVSRNDLMALTPEAAEVSGIPYVMDAFREAAEDILDA